jgi:hypothetical protein
VPRAYVPRYIDAAPLLGWVDHHSRLVEDWPTTRPTLDRILQRARERGSLTSVNADRIACALSTHLTLIYGEDYWEMPLYG